MRGGCVCGDLVAAASSSDQHVRIRRSTRHQSACKDQACVRCVFFFQQQGVAAFLPCNALILKSAVCILTPLPSYELHSKFGSKL